MSSRRRRIEEEDGESYFVSLSDLMAGVLFLFIIMLTYFALELQKTADAVAGRTPAVHARAKPAPVVAPPQAPPATVDLRTLLLQRLDAQLGVIDSPAKVDVSAGVVRIPNAVLFGPGGAQLSPGGTAALTGLAGAMVQVLPCAAFSPSLSRPDACPASPGRLAAVTVEGHAGAGADSLTQSAVQAAAVYRQLIAAQAGLGALKGDAAGAGPPLISVAGYASGAAGVAVTSDAVEIRLFTTQ